jgi:hypothetical protein
MHETHDSIRAHWDVQKNIMTIRGGITLKAPARFARSLMLHCNDIDELEDETVKERGLILDVEIRQVSQSSLAQISVILYYIHLFHGRCPGKNQRKLFHFLHSKLTAHRDWPGIFKVGT